MVFLQTEKAIRKASATVRSGVTADLLMSSEDERRPNPELKADEKRIEDLMCHQVGNYER